MSRKYYTVAVILKAGWFLPQWVRIKGNAVHGRIGNSVPDVSDWDPPPHVVFANLGCASPPAPDSPVVVKFQDSLKKKWGGFTPEPRQGLASVTEVRDFIERYGVLGTKEENESPEPGDEFEVLPILFGYMQSDFRTRWRQGDPGNVFHPLGGEEFNYYSLPFTRAKNSFELRLADLWTYMSFLLAQDLDGKRAGICQNKSCKTPYFVGRKSQKFCSHKCAVAVSVRAHRRRERRK